MPKIKQLLLNLLINLVIKSNQIHTQAEETHKITDLKTNRRNSDGETDFHRHTTEIHDGQLEKLHLDIHALRIGQPAS